MDAFEFHVNHEARCQLFAKGDAGLGPFSSNGRLVAGILEQLVVVESSCSLVMRRAIGNAVGRRDSGSRSGHASKVVSSLSVFLNML